MNEELPEAVNIDEANLPLIPEAPVGFKSGFVAIVGRPNVGKSTLMNSAIGQKIAITSPVSQTTRNRLQGILTTANYQIIFVDTPGIHKPHHQLGEVLVKNARSAIDAVDVVIFLVDGSQPVGGGDRFVADLLANCSVPVVLGLNKVDLRADLDEDRIAKIDAGYRELIGDRNWSKIDFCALNKERLTELIDTVSNSLEEGPYYYPSDLVTDRPERFIMGELIREQILHQTTEEIPHSVAITIDSVREEPAITRVMATINVERQSQKGIIIGKGGQKLKAIGTAARTEMQKLILGKVHLEIFVKVQPKWRHSRLRLSEFGYIDESN
jgi:GTP-binding protein Era